MIDWQDARARLAEDGVVHLPQVLDAAQLQAALDAWTWSLANPALGGKVPQATDSTFYQDLYNPRVLEGYRTMLEASPLPQICARLWGTDDVWFMYEQVFLKEGGETRRTPWHQDASYLPIGGLDTAVAWITFEPLAKEDSLEFTPARTAAPSTTAPASPWRTTPPRCSPTPTCRACRTSRRGARRGRSYPGR